MAIIKRLIILMATSGSLRLEVVEARLTRDTDTWS
jgi:hypothetical protein